MLDPLNIANHAILRRRMKVIVGGSTCIVDREGTKAAIADTERVKTKDSQLLRQGDVNSGFLLGIVDFPGVA